MQFDARLVKLETRLPDDRESDDEPPRVAGKPRHIVNAEYTEWLRKRIADPGRTEEQRKLIQLRIDELVVAYDRLKETS